MNTFPVTCAPHTCLPSPSVSLSLSLPSPPPLCVPVRVLMFVRLFGFVVMLIKSIIAQLCRRQRCACGQQVLCRDPSSKLPGLTSAHAALGSLVSGVRCLLLPSARSEDLNSPTTACVFVCNLDFNWKHTHMH